MVVTRSQHRLSLKPLAAQLMEARSTKRKLQRAFREQQPAAAELTRTLIDALQDHNKIELAFLKAYHGDHQLLVLTSAYRKCLKQIMMYNTSLEVQRRAAGLAEIDDQPCVWLRRVMTAETIARHKLYGCASDRLLTRYLAMGPQGH